jgi:hypothetical protein
MFPDRHLDATGNEVSAIHWMTNRSIELIESTLFPSGYPDWNDLQALYHSEYVKRAEGVDSFIYKRSKEEFKEKFARIVEDKVENDREGYLTRLLSDIIYNRKNSRYS